MNTKNAIRRYDSTGEICPRCIRDRQDCDCESTLAAPAEAPMQHPLGVRKVTLPDGTIILHQDGGGMMVL